MAGSVWENPQRPVAMGGVLMCPLCGSEVSGPFSATTSTNKIVKKWGCSRCQYVAKLEDGAFRSAFDANPVTFG